MSGVNKVILIGNLGSDPTVRFTSGGAAVANFNIATTERYNDRNGERQEREAQQLANLTGWDIDDIRGKIPLIADTKTDQPSHWWSRLWN